MKALRYKGPFSVAVEDVPDPRIEQPADAIIRITTTNICGSDLHMYEGRTNVEQDKVLGHENMGVVQEVGAGVDRIKVGDRVSGPFNIGCGTCMNCLEGWSSFCLRTNPNEGVDGAAYGYAQMCPYPGGQAEYLRVPYADFNLLELPPGDDFERDFTMLSDIFPTGYHGAELAGVRTGDRVAGLRRRSRGAAGRPQRDAGRRRSGVRRRQGSRPPGAGRKDRHADRLQHSRSGRAAAGRH